MNIPLELLERIKSSDIIVFEGFEMTGKSFLANYIRTDDSIDSILYRPDWEDSMRDSVIQRGNRYIPGIAIVDFWKKLPISKSKKLLLDRWLAVSAVYQKLYNQKTDVTDIDTLVDSHMLAVGDLKLLIVHKSHKDEVEAQKMYAITKSSSTEHNDIYDEFDGFEDYYKNYLKFNEAYMDFYKEYKLPVCVVSSLTNEILYYQEGAY